MKSTKGSLFAIVLLLFVQCPLIRAQQSTNAYSDKHALQINALEFAGRIYSFVYGYQFSPKNHLLLGVAYQNQEYDFGTTHAPSLIIGYRRYFWKGLNAEYALWPAYNMFYEKNEEKYYNSFEVWGEFRTGYDINFKIGKAKLFVLPQFIVGKGIITGDKPESFHSYYKNDEPVFIAGNIALGIKF